MTPFQILIIEDDPDGLQSVKEAIEEAGWAVQTATTGEAGVALFKSNPFDLVLSDLALPDIDGLEVMRRILGTAPDIPFLIMTAYGSVDTSIQAMKEGAYDYITKPLDLDDLQSKVARALETRRLRRKVEQLSDSVKQRYSTRAMVAQAPAMQELVRQIEALADTNATALVRGESGTGKELVARALHVDSRRASGPFVAVNCGAFAETLLESELFGHEKGSFTGASAQHQGAFERADGGTLFLDEIGDAPKPVQVKLLRVIEEREVIRVGGQASFHVDVRLVSASNRDLEALVEEGEFREDLLYRLNVVTVSIPPLRERRDDIRALVDRFLVAATEEHGRYIRSVGQDYYDALQNYDWPGNVRQLRNAVEASVVMARTAELTADALNLPGRKRRAEAPTAFTIPEGMTLDELEREILTQALQRYEGNRTLTAEKLGLSRRTIQRKITEHDLPF